MVEDIEIQKRRREIETLRSKLGKKQKIFDLIRREKNEEATKILLLDDESRSYFYKFRHEMLDRKLFNQHVIIFDNTHKLKINYNPNYESEILEDFERLKKEIEEKENRLEQRVYLQKQQEYLKEQKNDILEGKKDRKRIQDFTFVLAFGVIASIMFNWFQIFVEFEYAQKAHLMIMGAIFIMLFTIMIFFLIYSMRIGREIRGFVGDWRYILGTIVTFIIIVFLVWLLLITPNEEINQPANKEIRFFNSSFQEYKEIKENETVIMNNILENQNDILKEQIKINSRLEGLSSG
jgi:hypothetical protein